MMAAGCATSQEGRLGSHFVKHGEPTLSYTDTGVSEQPAPRGRAEPLKSEPLKPMKPRPANSSNTIALEQKDRRLKEELRLLAEARTAARLRSVAASYRRLSVFDQAHAYISQAAKRDPRDFQVFEERAKILRDWGLPQSGLGDAHRAVFLAPSSPSARNTLGTVLQALGDLKGARVQFEKVLQLDGTASYAFSNLCYVSMTEGKLAEAQDECGRAIGAEPDLRIARTQFNLGVVYMAAGQRELAEDAFRRAESLGHPTRGSR
jgi:Flp pilus assembly protein TadD